MTGPIELEKLLAQLEQWQPQAPRGDAIDQVLAAPPRQTSAPSLRHHETVQKFRAELSTGRVGLENTPIG